MDSSLKNIYSIYTLVVERELTVCVLLILAMIHIVASCTCLLMSGLVMSCAG